MNRNKLRPFIYSFILFLICLHIGFFIAEKKILWRDEISSHVHTVHALSYPKLFLSFKYVKEGNVCPLSYIVQKAVTDLFQYRLPGHVTGEYWIFEDKAAQFFLRITPVLFMSLAIALIFYYFSEHYSFSWGMYALAVTLSSYMIWTFWAEARQYALWILLTTVQSILYLSIHEAGSIDKKMWLKLSLLHLFLSATIVLSVIQISVVSLLLFIFIDRDWRRYTAIFLLPAALSLFYSFHAPDQIYRFNYGPMALISSSIPKDRMAMIALAGFYLLWRQAKRAGGFQKLISREFYLSNHNREIVQYLFFALVMILGVFGLLSFMKLKGSADPHAFEIPNRYFANLTPIGIFTTTLLSIYLIRATRQKKIQILIIIILGVLLFIRSFRTFELVQSVVF